MLVSGQMLLKEGGLKSSHILSYKDNNCSQKPTGNLCSPHSTNIAQTKCSKSFNTQNAAFQIGVTPLMVTGFKRQIQTVIMPAILKTGTIAIDASDFAVATESK